MYPRKLLEIFVLVPLISLFGAVHGYTNPNDFKILDDFRDGLSNAALLKWPGKGNDPCGPPAWSHVYCSNGRVTQIQVQGLGLKGTLPQNLNQLDKLQNIGLQKNQFSGTIPSLNGLSSLQYAYLDFNQFDTIPADFFRGLSSVRVLALDNNPFNESNGWSIPSDVSESTQLMNFSCSYCNVVGQVPDYFGKFSSLASLRLSGNRLSGPIPLSLNGSGLQILWLNDQDGGGMSGPIDVIGTMVSLTKVWLHGNNFLGPIPDSIGSLTSLTDFNVNKNRLVGLIPPALANMALQSLDLSNNMFMGAIPKFKAVKASFDTNSFCQSDPGQQCAPEVNDLLAFLHDVGYPDKFASQWSGNNPCNGWWGISCNPSKSVSVVNLQNLGLNGTLSPWLAGLSSLSEIHLEGNNLHGMVPANLTMMKSLKLLNLSNNHFDTPLPKFPDTVKVVFDGNTKFVPSPGSKNNPSFPDGTQPSSGGGTGSGSDKDSGKSTMWIVIGVVAAVLSLIAVVLVVYYYKKKRKTKKARGVHPKDSSDQNDDEAVEIAVVDSSSAKTQSGGARSRRATNGNNGQMIKGGGFVFSLQTLRKATDDFAPECELGKGGFGVVYKGKLEDGTMLAVKRMEAGVLGKKGLSEFHSEISVLSDVRHRNLVSLLGYCAEGNERLLVYEYMSRSALSRHLFRWKTLNIAPLSWTTRLNIALDVARGVEYLHGLAHQSFIHRDLKSANILLDDNYRAKVADFGLVKLAPDEEKSIATRLAGTFGYLAPEYAVTGKITTKVDVFSFGVILMEIVTGLTALDEHRSEENQYLAEWFWKIKFNKDLLIAAIDPALDATEDIYESIFIIAELAGHCTTKDPSRRPDIGHAVNILARLVDKWQPYEEETERYSTTNGGVALPDLLKGWQEEGDTQDFTSNASHDSKGRVPSSKPSGFATSFNSADAR